VGLVEMRKLDRTSTLIKKKKKSTHEATKLCNKRGKKKDSRLYMASILTKHENIYSKSNKELFIYLKKTTKSCVATLLSYFNQSSLFI
jgi:hypothetical protein